MQLLLDRFAALERFANVMQNHHMKNIACDTVTKSLSNDRRELGNSVAEDEVMMGEEDELTETMRRFSRMETV
jgi:hypothetical protein